MNKHGLKTNEEIEDELKLAKIREVIEKTVAGIAISICCAAIIMLLLPLF